MRGLAHRLLSALALLLGVSLLSFLLLEIAPGDYVDEMRLSPQVSPETVAGLRIRYGLDGSAARRYGSWLSSVLRGDWGFSFAYQTPVEPLLFSRAKNTLLLGFTAMIVAWIIAIPAGLSWAESRRGGAWDRLLSAASSLLLGLPSVLLALLFLRLALETGAFPVGGMRSPDSELSLGSGAGDVFWHMALPVLALSLSSLGVALRHVRSAVAEVRRKPFVEAARARGLGGSYIRLYYVLLPACHPLLALLGLSIASLLSGSLLVEVVFGWPGLGPLLLEAILSRDVHVVLGAVMGSAAFLVIGSVIADCLMRLADPRLSAVSRER